MERRRRELDFERAALYRDRLAALSRSSRSRASIPAASKRPTCSPSTRRAAIPASRSSSSAPDRIGATAHIFRRPKRRCAGGGARRRSCAVLRRQAAPRLILLSHEIEDAELLAEALSTKSRLQSRGQSPQRGEKKDSSTCAAPMRARRSDASSPIPPRSKSCLRAHRRLSGAA